MDIVKNKEILSKNNLILIADPRVLEIPFTKTMKT